MSDYNYRDAILKALADNKWQWDHNIFDAIEPEYELKQKAFYRDLRALTDEGLIEYDGYEELHRLSAPLPDAATDDIIDWDAPITDADIERIEELVAKYGEDPIEPKDESP